MQLSNFSSSAISPVVYISIIHHASYEPWNAINSSPADRVHSVTRQQQQS